MRDLKREADTMLKNMKKATAERDRAEQQRILENQWKREAKEQAEADRIEQSNELMDKYIQKAMSRQKANEDRWEQSRKAIHDNAEARRKAEEQEHRKREIKKMIAHGEELIKQGAKYN